MSPFWKNILLILGTTVGAGIFSLPQLLQRIGFFWYIIFLLVFAFLMYRINWFYLKIIKSIKGNHQLSGYVDRVLDKRWGGIAVILHLFSTYGALIAFILIGGEFLGATIGITAALGNKLFFALTVIVMLISGKKAENIDVLFSLLKGAMFLIIVGLCLFSIESWERLPVAQLTVPAEAMGAFIFAFTGFSIMPELHKEKDEGKSIFTAQTVILLIYFLFTMAVIPFWQGNEFVFNNRIIDKAFSLTGFISVFTAYLLSTWVGKDIYVEDLGIKENMATGLILLVPFLTILFQVGTFLTVLSVTGGVFVAGSALLICWMYQKQHPGKNRGELAFIQLLLIATILFEIYTFING